MPGGNQGYVLMVILLWTATSAVARAETTFHLASGELRITLEDAIATGQHGVSDGDTFANSDSTGWSTFSLLIDDASDFSVRMVEGVPVFEGTIIVDGGLHFLRETGSRTVRRLALHVDHDPNAPRLVGYDLLVPEEQAFVAVVGEVMFDPVAGTIVLVADDITLRVDWARALGRKTERLVGSLTLRALLERPDAGAEPLPDAEDVSVESSGSVGGAIPDPDIIVGSVTGWGIWGVSGGIGAYSIGATSCNIGTDPANWIAGTPQHPVIGQSFYRLKDNRFEQLGISWVKHGFAALNGTLCCPTGVNCCQDEQGTTSLGVGCSDPYDAGLNGTQANLGPRSHINAHTGVFPANWSTIRPPLSNPPIVYERRLQIRQDELFDIGQFPNIKYYAEIEYVAADDSLAGNQDNNVSYREAIVPGTTVLGAKVLSFPGSAPTVRTHPAIKAWKVNDPSVEEIQVRVPDEGLFYLSAKVSDQGNGVWEYEYALFNQNSHRSAGSFRVPIRPGAVVQNIGFHDVNYHSGEPYDLTDWSVSTANNAVTWSTTPYSTNENANALRWGTMYNFRFQTNVEPAPTTIDIGLFRPGSPDTVAARIVGPGLEMQDCNLNGVEDRCDIDCNALGCGIPCGGSVDCNNNGVPDSCEPDCNGNGQADECDIALGVSEDCQPNTVPDECESDCDEDGVPNTCDPDTTADCDGDGIIGCEDLCPCSSPVNFCVCPPICGCCIFDSCFEYPCAECAGIGGVPQCTEAPCRAGCTFDETNGDSDADGDHDLRDLWRLTRCFSDQKEKPAYSNPPVACQALFDLDVDDDVDLHDVDLIVDVLSGPGGEP